ncbi:MAG: type II toxin-antitoxin system HicB family antitoxin [Coriobacteriia bacterium]|nr:type II toxin-antitoxin system HicB family antitoxin [Coriobacteriia bacterium]
MRRFTYEAVIEKQDGKYSVYFPQLKDAFTEGRTRAEALDNAADVLSLVVGGLLDEKKPLPRPEHVAECINISIVLSDEDIDSLKYLTLTQAAEDLKISPGRVTQLVTAGKLRDRYFNGLRMVSIESVNDYKRSPRKAGRPKRNLVNA